MYEDNIYSSLKNTASDQKKGFFAERHARKIERIKEQVLIQFKRYETIKAEYCWLGRKWYFVMHDDYCETREYDLSYADKFTSTMIKKYVDECERRAKRCQEKRLKQERRRAEHADLYGNLELRVLALDGKFKYRKHDVKVTLPGPVGFEEGDEYYPEYNNYDKICLEKIVVMLERAHQERLDYISGKTEVSATAVR